MTDARHHRSHKTTKDGSTLVRSATSQQKASILDELFGDLRQMDRRCLLTLNLVLKVVSPLSTMKRRLLRCLTIPIERDDEDFFAAYIINQVLGAGGFESRLMEEVREKRADLWDKHILV